MSGVKHEPGEVARLEERLRKLASEKAYLQLVNRMMSRLSVVPGLENTIDNLLRTVFENVGGTNILLHYRIDDELHVADAFGRKERVERIEDELVRRVAETGEFIAFEHAFSDAQMVGPEFSEASTWVFPLTVGPERVGVLKMEGMLKLMKPELQPQLATFFNYAALILKNEILGYSRLKRAHDELAERNRALTDEVAERRRVEEELRAAQEAAEAASLAKSEFLANMSHEIRTPMNGVLGMSELLMETELGEVQRQYLGMVKSSADALLALINDILDFSKIEAGKLELDQTPFVLREVVESTAEAVAVRAHQGGLELIVWVDPDLPEAFVGDPGRLRQVLLNLLSNAVKFTEAGEVVVSVEGGRTGLASPTGPTKLRFTVTDTGIGIPADKLSQLFQSFTQLDTSPKRKQGGTGLGLAISQRIVNAMGGTIRVESPVLGACRSPRHGPGSAFSFQLELPSTDSPEARSAGPESLAGLRALVLDDNAMNREVLARCLEKRGVRVEVAAAGRQAVEKLLAASREGDPFQVALLDMHLPDTDGLLVVEETRKELSVAELAIMMITSDDVPGAAWRCRELGVGGYLIKPVRLAPLLDAVSRLVGLCSASGDGEGEPRPAGAALPPGLHVLLAEDNEVNRALVEELLRRRGVSVTSVPDGRGVLAALASARFDLVLMDVQMPELDGYEATRALRKAGSPIPVVGLTAHAMKGDREKCLAAGMDDYLTKPISAEALYDRVGRWAVAGRVDGPACAARGPGPGSGLVRPESAPTDLASLLAALGGDTALLRQLTEKLVESSPALLAELRRAARSGDAAAARRAAHSLRGSLLVFGAAQAAAVADEIEQRGAGGSLEGIEPRVADLETEIRRLIEFLATHPSLS